MVSIKILKEVKIMNDELLEALGLENNKYTISLPNPYDINRPWINIRDFEKYEDALEFVKNIGGDIYGRIETIKININNEK